MHQYTPKQITRFWSKVGFTANPNKCWEWQAYRNPRGYGSFGLTKTVGSHAILAHRAAWELTYGEIPDGLFICHHCDNRACCNPSHLFISTNQDNVNDMVNKGRNSKGTKHALNRIGEKNGNHKLTAKEVKYIRERYAMGGISYKELGREMGISKPTIGHIIRREIWK